MGFKKGRGNKPIPLDEEGWPSKVKIEIYDDGKRSVSCENIVDGICSIGINKDEYVPCQKLREDNKNYRR
jgi:hypothetical protein